MCIDSAVVPKFFCVGVMSNIAKKGENPSECSGHSPITVSTTLSKVLERIVLPEIVSTCPLDYRQFGFRRNLSCAFAHRVLKRIISKAGSSGSPLFVCSVDISSALDSVTQARVFISLLESGVNAYVVACLSYWY